MCLCEFVCVGVSVRVCVSVCVCVCVCVSFPLFLTCGRFACRGNSISRLALTVGVGTSCGLFGTVSTSLTLYHTKSPFLLWDTCKIHPLNFKQEYSVKNILGFCDIDILVGL